MKILTSSFACVLLGMSCGHVLAAVDPTAIVGALSGKISVGNNGNANYRIPLKVSPGSAGMQPGLALMYDSQGRNGLAGVGWSLKGLSSIHRCASNKIDDGVIDGVDFDDNDRFCIDGQRLVAVNGVYGADGTEYRTRNESFNKVFSYGSAGNGPAWFSLSGKDGKTIQYGYSADSRVEAQGKTDVLFWKINKTQDRYGNYQSVSYFEDNTVGESYPTRIDYTGNTAAGLTPAQSVRFEYESRPDVTPKYLSGASQKLTKRLAKVAVFNGETRAWDFQLAYAQGGATGRSRLSSVTQCDSTGECLSPTTLTWQDKAAKFETPQKWLEHADANAYPYSNGGILETYVDLNGDGMMDKVWVPNGLKTLWGALANGTGFELPTQLLAYADANVYPYSGSGRHERYVDFNGDGLADKLWVPSGLTNLWLAVNNGNGFDTPVEILHYTAANVQPFSNSGHHDDYVDLNGDGLMDKVWVPSGLTSLWGAISNGTSFETPTLLLQYSDANVHAYSNSGRYDDYIDLNGDGLKDKVWLPNGLTSMWAAMANGSGFDTPYLVLQYSDANVHAYSSSGVHQKYVDVNGDGLLDKVWVPKGLKTLWVALSNGEGFNTPQMWLDYYAANVWPFSGGGVHTRFTDLNGDGLSDMIWVPDGLRTLWVAYSNGKGFDTPEQWLDYTVASVYPYSSSGKYDQYVDVNGDGMTDKVWVPNGLKSLWVALAKPALPDLLTGITNGQGAQTLIEYKPLTDDTVYTKGTTATYPVIDLQSPSYVVSQINSSNAVGGLSAFIYHYSGLKNHRNGLGNLGFEQITSTDVDKGHVTTKTFSHNTNDRLMGRLLRSTTTIGNVVLSDRNNVWQTQQLVANGETRYLQQLLQTTDVKSDLNDAFIHSELTTSEYDSYGNVTKVTETLTDGAANVYSRITANTYSNDLVNWQLGLLTRVDQTRQMPGQAALTRSNAWQYNALGAKSKAITEPDNVLLRHETSYSHDVYGHAVTITESGPDFMARTNTVQYDALGRFAIGEVNALGHTNGRTYDNASGQMLSSTDSNGLTSTFSYDGFGRQIGQTRPDGVTATTSYNWCAADCPAGAVYFIIKASDDRSPTVTYYSETGRELRKRTVAMDGRYNHIDRQFDSLGQNTHVSEPYFVGDTIYWTITVFDTQGRPVQTTNPDGSVTNTSYNGLTTTSTNVLGHIKVQVKDVLGNQLAVTDNAGGTILLNFDGFNQLLQTQDPNGNTTTLSYNSRGWKTAMSDPNKGSWSYQYNAKGELTSQTDAKGQTIQSTYDLLGRITSRIDKRSDASIQNNSNWYYDNSADPDGGASPTMALGKLHWVEETVSGYRQIQLYDALSRKSQTLTRLDGNDYSQHVTYDSFSRVQDSFDVSGSGIRHFYNANGQLEKRQDISSTNILGTVYWQAITQDARGNVTQQKLGNGSDVYRVFNAQTGRIDDIVTLGATTQVLQYQYDVAGNLQQRYEQSDVKMLTENFSYDNMNRLVAANVVGGAQQTISYDLMGNILTKTGLSGTYQYGGSCNGVTAGPHAVTSAGGQSYCYDNNGNQISGNGRTLQYSVFDKPVDISKGSHNTQFGYGPARHRFKRTDIDNEKAETTTTHYLGNVEVITRPTGVVEYKRAINGGVIVTTRSNGTSDVRYLHKDHLGSIDMITDESGLLVQSLSFDAFGKRRDTLSWDQFADPYFQLANINDILNITTRGFTGHEMLDQVGLIHMGGRVFDAHLGRFLQADPIIQAPTNSQSYNRYSYVLNNPLSYTDPSGFFFKSLKKFIKKYWRPILAAIAVIVTIGIATPLVASLGAIWGTAATATSAASLTFMGSAVVGAISGAVSGAIMTGSLEGAWKGAVTGALMGGVNGYFGNSWNMQRVAANGVAKGITARINGGKFMDGLKGSLATSLLTLANYRMRADMVRQSKINPDNIGKDSKGFFGDGHGIAGTRRIVNPDFGRVPGVAKYLKCDGPAGGCQGPVLPGSTDVGSRVGPISYKAGSIYDTLTESFSGPHDWLSDKIGMYDAQGNGIHRSGFIGGFYSTASAVLIPVAAPFAVAGLIETQPGLFR